MKQNVGFASVRFMAGHCRPVQPQWRITGNRPSASWLPCSEGGAKRRLLLQGAIPLLFPRPFCHIAAFVCAKLQYCVYVLLSKADGQLYAGYSTDLDQRLTDHFEGHVPSTASRRPLRLIYCEYHISKTDALRREKYFKTTAGKKGLKLMLRETLAEFRHG